MVLVGLAIATGWFLLIVPGGYLRHGPPYCEKPLGPPPNVRCAAPSAALIARSNSPHRRMALARVRSAVWQRHSLC